MKIALVTGAYKGLGFEWCRQLGKIGYKEILTARKPASANTAAELLKHEGLDIYPIPLDVKNENQIEEIALWVFEHFGHIDLIVNNAGINPKDYADKTKMAKAFYLEALDANEMLDIIHINSIAPLLIVKHFKKLLIKSDHPVVVNISSWLGSVSNLTFGGHYGYVGSKNLLNILNKSMANELRQDKIICINVNPGWVKTDMGGQKAQFSPEQAVTNIITNIVLTAKINDSGKIFNFAVSEHPW